MKYPFTPELLDALPEELAELYRALEDTLLNEICSRLKVADQLNEVTVQDIRALRSHGIDLKDIEKAIRKTTGISEKKLKELLTPEESEVLHRPYRSRPCHAAGNAGERRGHMGDIRADKANNEKHNALNGLFS